MHSLTTHRRDDGILLLHIRDTLPETVKAWSSFLTETLDHCTKPDKHLQDFRDLSGFSSYAMRVGIKIKSHPNIEQVTVAVVVNKSRTTDLASLILSIQPGGRFRLFQEIDEAIAWLNTHVPT